jgi:hypothetical protein
LPLEESVYSLPIATLTPLRDLGTVGFWRDGIAAPQPRRHIAFGNALLEAVQPVSLKHARCLKETECCVTQHMSGFMLERGRYDFPADISGCVHETESAEVECSPVQLADPSSHRENVSRFPVDLHIPNP